jgi:outer membrane beta-barrel protein
MRRALLLSLLLTVALPARAQTTAAPIGPALTATGPVVQNRKYRLRTELWFGPALLPSDAYTKEGGLSLGITHHFSDLVAWEIVHAHGYLSWRSGLREQLEDNFGVPPQRFAYLLAAVDTNIVISPVYAKFSLTNRHLVYLQLFALAGGGAGLVLGGEPEGGSTAPGRGLHAAALFDVGLGLRLWLSPRWSLRYDLRQYVSVDTATLEVTPPLYMSLAFAASLGGGR